MESSWGPLCCWRGVRLTRWGSSSSNCYWMYASVHRFCAHGCDLAPVLSLQQKRRLIGMLTHFSATYLLSALVLFPLLQWVTVFLPLKIKLAEIIKIDFDYLEMLCTAMWWIQSIYIEPHRLRHTLFLFWKWLAQQFQNLSILFGYECSYFAKMEYYCSLNGVRQSEK